MESFKILVSHRDIRLMVVGPLLNGGTKLTSRDDLSLWQAHPQGATKSWTGKAETRKQSALAVEISICSTPPIIGSISGSGGWWRHSVEPSVCRGRG